MAATRESARESGHEQEAVVASVVLAVVEPVIRPEIAVSPPEINVSPLETISSVAQQDGGWLLQQPEAAFTIQLVTFSSAERAEVYLAGQREPGRFARYRYQRNGRVLHVVVFGIFDSRAEALAAADQLPAAVGDVRPWVRPINQLKETIRTALAR